MSKKLTTEEFIKNSKKIHGEVYDYSVVDYKGNKVKVDIICYAHGEFSQKPNNHISLKHGCPECKKAKHVKRYTKTFEDFHKQAEKKYNKYHYDKKDFKGFSEKMKMFCKKHDYFEQTPYRHLNNKYGCPKCAIEKNTKLPIDLRDLVKKAKGCIQQSYIRKNFTKKSRTYKLLGCSWEEYREHLENNEYGFTIYGEDLDLDHIIPISSAKTEKDIIRLNHYTNFQLLPSIYNRNVKRDKPYNKYHFEEWLKTRK